MTTEWRTKSTTMADCLRHIFDTKDHADVTFEFPRSEGRTIKAHKLVLSMRSAVFETMFYGSKAVQSDTVVIEDIEADTFEHMLRFLYTDEFDVPPAYGVKCLFAARLYSLETFVVKCEHFLKESLSPETVCFVLEEAKLFNLSDLHDLCDAYILDNADVVMAV
ncbi:BTB/POZ domain-containing protein 2-like [Mya arenaria]|uniref:BTB/POZ domain-containing protein 2-like n=1 Tax=Mya arenaria TaxID=6604 RepID=UPI0022E93E79|nr:BTB/POZ domain-containing protein 2-like [Mya arenaria]